MIPVTSRAGIALSKCGSSFAHVIGAQLFQSMDLYKIISELYVQRGKLDRVIAALEELQRVQQSADGLATPPRRRGRKSMSAEERLQVSEGMKEYWQNRRRTSRLL
jgi:hypothetical protein